MQCSSLTGTCTALHQDWILLHLDWIQTADPRKDYDQDRTWIDSIDKKCDNFLLKSCILDIIWTWCYFFFWVSKMEDCIWIVKYHSLLISTSHQCRFTRWAAKFWNFGRISSWLAVVFFAWPIGYFGQFHVHLDENCFRWPFLKIILYFKTKISATILFQSWASCVSQPEKFTELEWTTVGVCV